jgi:hypothetical protein
MSQISNARTDFYTLVHKGLRKRLFDAIVRAGTTDFADEGSRRQLADDVKDLVQTLRGHAKHEETFLHPILAEAMPVLAESLDREHEEHDRALGDVERAFDAAFAQERVPGDAVRDASRDPGHLAYRALARFAAFYLGHLEREEEGQPAVWACVDEARLSGAMRSFLASRTEAQSLEGRRMILPAMNAAEKVSLQSRLEASSSLTRDASPKSMPA